MSATTWAAKRFWTSGAAVKIEGGFGVNLDGRPIKTPAKSALVVPTQALAEAILAEWLAQEKLIRPETMPFTRMANSAIDKVLVQFKEVADFVAAYGASDLLCYRATHPQELINRQAEAWDPVLKWTQRRFNAPLAVQSGVMPLQQDLVSVEKLRAVVHSFGHFEIAALHDLVAISGSLILALAVMESNLSVADIWEGSRIDETWQNEQWGADDEAIAAETVRREDLFLAARFLDCLRIVGT